MSLVKFKNRIPWISGGENWLDTNDFFADDFFHKKEHLPAMNVKENPNEFEIELAVPGFSKKEIEVSLEDNILHIHAEKSKKEVEDKEDYTRKEFSYNSFDRKLEMPSLVNQKEEIKATYQNGILKLHLIKSESAKVPPKRIVPIN